MFDDEIPWRLRPIVPLPPVAPDLSTADEIGLLYADVVAQEAHLQSVTADLAMYRELVQQALDQLSSLTALVAKQQARILSQQQQIAQLMDLR